MTESLATVNAGQCTSSGTVATHASSTHVPPEMVRGTQPEAERTTGAGTAGRAAPRRSNGRNACLTSGLGEEPSTGRRRKEAHMRSATPAGRQRRRGRHERPPVTLWERLRNLMLLDPLPVRATDTSWEPGGRKCHDRISVALIVIEAGARLVFRQQSHIAYTRLEVALTFITGLFAACLISMAGALLGIIGATPLAVHFGYCAAVVAIGSALSILRVARMSTTARRARRQSNQDPLAFGLAAIGGIPAIPLQVYTRFADPTLPPDVLPISYTPMSLDDAERAGETLEQAIRAWLEAELSDEIARDTFTSLQLEFDGTLGELVAVARDLAHP